MFNRQCVASCPSPRSTFDATRKLCHQSVTLPETHYTSLQNTLDRLYTGDKITLQGANNAVKTYATRLTVTKGVHLLGGGSAHTILAEGIKVTGEVGYLTVEALTLKYAGTDKAILSMDDNDGRIDTLHIKNCIFDGQEKVQAALMSDSTGFIAGTITITGTTFKDAWKDAPTVYIGANEANFRTGRAHLRAVTFTSNTLTNNKGGVVIRGHKTMTTSSGTITGNTMIAWKSGASNLDAAITVSQITTLTFSTNTIQNVAAMGSQGKGCAAMMYCTAAW